VKPIKHSFIDCTTLKEALKGKVEVKELEDLYLIVPHVGYGGAMISTYVSPNSGKDVFVLERYGLYAADAYVTEVWQFEEPFTAEEARLFLEQADNLKTKVGSV
jgi:hypothetical protein